MSEVEIPVNDLIRGIRSVVKEMLAGHLIFIDKERVMKGKGSKKGKFIVMFGTTAKFKLTIEIDVKQALTQPNYFHNMVPQLHKSIEMRLAGK